MQARPIPVWSQRLFDLTLTLSLAPIVLVVGALIGLAIYIDSPGPVIYRSRRVGRNGRPFEMLKFRKMRSGVEGAPLTLSDDERFTPIGRFLAATRLDELPQIWNVLRGEMRLVGPRPELEVFVNEFASQYAEILTATPGITGPSQLRFFDEGKLLGGADPAASYRDEVLPVKLLVDLDYVRRPSLVHDSWLLVRTAFLPLELAIGSARSHPTLMRSLASAACAGMLLVAGFLLTSSSVV